jgi:hypothetical protein
MKTKLRAGLLSFLIFGLLAVHAQSTGKVQTNNANAPGTIQNGVSSSVNSVKMAPLVVSAEEIEQPAGDLVTGKFHILGQPVTECGICYSLKTGPTLNDNTVKSDLKSADQELGFTVSKPNTKHFVRAYAKNAKGIFYSNEVTFTSGMFEVKTKTKPTKGGDHPTY